ncbi:(2Fe-2S)-binding protein [soil metagenome]
MKSMPIQLMLNGGSVTEAAEPRRLLSDFIREDCGLTGTHVGCEHGVCGACTVLIDGRSARSCLTFAAQVQGCHIETVESVAGSAGQLSALQEAFRQCHALQCGFCTPGFLMVGVEYLRAGGSPDRDAIRDAISGNLCRCTGYETIIDAISQVARANLELKG